MKKEELKETIIAILHYLKNRIYNDVPVTLDDAIAHVQKHSMLFSNVNYNSDSLDQMLEAIKDECEQLARESISSYENSTENIRSIAKKQHEELKLIEVANDKGEIDLNTVKEKFSSIQDSMLKEIEHANTQIYQLKEKVKLLEEKSNLDPLTKIFNRRALENYLNQLTKKDNIKKELHLLMIDIDDFKQINDKYGHVAGDKILVFIANKLKNTLRDGDKIFRYGGEEFVIILNRIDTQNCIKIANRILKVVENNKFTYKDNTIHVTISAGGTNFVVGDTPETILERADQALYEAKRTGKNKFVSKKAQ